MQAVIKATETDQWNNPEVQRFKKLKEEFSVDQCCEETAL